MKKILIFLIPLLIFLGGTVFLYSGLFSDPKQLESVVKGKPMPSFNLPDLFDDTLNHTSAVFDNQVTLLNVWGVWCVTCAVELPYLNSLVDDENLRIIGLYFDQDLDPEFGTKTLKGVRKEVIAMLDRFGDPYRFQIFDVRRDLALDLGVTGAPEHFLIDKKGIVRWHHVGDINEYLWKTQLKQIVATLRAEPY